MRAKIVQYRAIGYLCALVMLAFFPNQTIGAPRHSKVGLPEFRRFANELKFQLRAAGLSRLDTNGALAPLIEIGATSEIPPEPHFSKYLSETPSLARAYEIQQSVRRLSVKLEKAYGFKLQRSRGDIVIPPPPADDRRVDAWGILNVIFRQSPYLKSAPDTPIKKRSALRWNSPLRIASTGNPIYDEQIRRTLAELKTQHPSLPIDRASFPASVEKANLFVDIDDVVCRAGASCKLVDTWPEFDRIQNTKPIISSRLPMMRALVFFGRLNGNSVSGGWPIYAMDASAGAGGRPISAWLRIGADGRIHTAGCTGIATWWPKAGKGPAIVDPPERADFAGKVRNCLAAALGAPTHLRDWSLTEAPPAVCGPAECIRGYRQEEELKHLYGPSGA